MERRRNSTVTQYSNLTANDSLTDIVFVATISILLMLTACFFYVLYKIYSNEIPNEQNKARFKNVEKELIEIYIIPHNSLNSSSCYDAPVNLLHGKLPTGPVNTSADEHFACYLKFRLDLEKIFINQQHAQEMN